MYGIITGGMDPLAPLLHELLSAYEKFEPPRLRDIYFDKHGTITVYTRTGGGNRETYKDENEALTQHPLYQSNADDSFDCTYAYWRFKIPDGITVVGHTREDAGDRVRKIIEDMSDPNPSPKSKEASKRVRTALAPLFVQLDKVIKEKKGD